MRTAKHCPLFKEKGRKACFSDNSVCGYIGYYVECPSTLKDKNNSQKADTEGNTRGVKNR